MRLKNRFYDFEGPTFFFVFSAVSPRDFNHLDKSQDQDNAFIIC